MNKVSIARRRIETTSRPDASTFAFRPNPSVFPARPTPFPSREPEPASPAAQHCTLAVPLSTEQNHTVQSLAQNQEVAAVCGQILPRAGLIILEINSEPGLPAEMLDSGEIAQMLNISRKSVYRLAATGQLKAHRVGHMLRFTREQVREFLDNSDLHPGRQR